MRKAKRYGEHDDASKSKSWNAIRSRVEAPRNGTYLEPSLVGVIATLFQCTRPSFSHKLSQFLCVLPSGRREVRVCLVRVLDEGLAGLWKGVSRPSWN